MVKTLSGHWVLQKDFLALSVFLKLSTMQTRARVGACSTQSDLPCRQTPPCILWKPCLIPVILLSFSWYLSVIETGFGLRFISILWHNFCSYYVEELSVMLVGLTHNWLCRYVFTVQIAVPTQRHMVGNILWLFSGMDCEYQCIYLIVFVVYCCLNILNHNQCQVIVEVKG